MPIPEATSNKLSKSTDAAKGDTNGPCTHTGLLVGFWSGREAIDAWSFLVQSPVATMETAECPGLSKMTILFQKDRLQAVKEKESSVYTGGHRPRTGALRSLWG